MIDAYTHCGIVKFEPVERVSATMTAAGVKRAVLCQHLGEYDNGYLEAVVRAHPSTFTAVAMVDPSDAAWADTLDAIAASGSFRGIRLTTDMLAVNPDLARAVADAGLVPMLYTPNGVALAKPMIASLAGSVRGRNIVVTHLGCPVVENGRIIAGWDLFDLAKFPNVMVTLSGQGMFCDYPHRALDLFVRSVFQAFGAGRVMWGSNFPVLGDADAYARDLALVRAGSWGLSPGDIASVTETNAAEVFFAPTITPS